jgi:hypothetical protein
MKAIKGYEGLYAIDEEGNVFSLRTQQKKKMKPTDNGKGYMRVGLRKNNKTKKHFVHRLMAEAYLSNFSEELNVDHIDRDKGNNSLSNLRMVTTQENSFNTNAKGYHWHKHRGKWLAQIMKDNKPHHLGYFTCPLLARVAYLSAKRSLHTFSQDAVASSVAHKNGE